ncbi:hypothetical protein ACFLVW_01340 [Chloroflexota bacterium]
MLLIDGVKYELWTPPSEDEFEQVVKEHAQDIFGEQSIYLDRKQKLKSLAGIGSIPDGYVITLGDAPQWHIVEVELSSHPLHEHIVPQVGKFIGGISNPNIQRVIVNAIDEQIKRDDFLMLKLRKAIEPVEIHRFLTELVSKQPIITIIIEEDTEELREALNILRYPQIKVVEFQTFTREGVGLPVHAHLFEPLYAPVSPIPSLLFPPAKERFGLETAKRSKGLKLYVKDGKHYNPKEALVVLGTTLNKMVEGGWRATIADGTILEYVGSTKDGKSKIAKVHAYLLNHGFTFSQ